MPTAQIKEIRVYQDKAGAISVWSFNFPKPAYYTPGEHTFREVVEAVKKGEPYPTWLMPADPSQIQEEKTLIGVWNSGKGAHINWYPTHESGRSFLGMTQKQGTGDTLWKE